ncbi:hypothetical protein Pcinc_000983 [Petrolisthes cinctipes]|uniref:Uncharacterized protein n=1 Tax=Petrolisthes cinctipes TaxID=88211 RepID=A0AAE1GNT3_PETCI|nr:hypothetical protein Pcinc_000983 [Petrolisthes cinctipes]
MNTAVMADIKNGIYDLPTHKEEECVEQIDRSPFIGSEEEQEDRRAAHEADLTDIQDTESLDQQDEDLPVQSYLSYVEIKEVKEAKVFLLQCAS